MLGTAGVAQQSPFYILKFPSSTVAKVLQLRFTLNMTATGTVSPEILSFRVKGQLRPTSNPIYSLKVYLADDLLMLNGATSRSRSEDLRRLRTWNETAGEILLSLPGHSGFV